MANETYAAQVWQPEVCKPMLQELFKHELKITQYAKKDFTLKGRPGSKIKYTRWKYAGKAVKTLEGANIAIRQMGYAQDEYEIEKFALGFKLSNEAILYGDGDPKGSALRMLAKGLREAVEDRIHEAVAQEAKLIYDNHSNKISYNGIVGAVSRFGDEEEGNQAFMFVHSRQYSDILMDSNFMSKDKFDKTVVPKGVVGQISGAWVKISNRIIHEDNTQGSREVTIGGTIATDDTFTIAFPSDNEDEDDKVFTYKAAANDAASDVATGLAALINADTDLPVSALASSSKVTLSEKTGFYGFALFSEPTLEKDSTAGTITLGGTYSGACTFLNPILKNEIDSEETDYSDKVLPAITLHVKQEAEFYPEYKNENDTWLITATILVGVAITNDAKIVVAKFKG